MIKGYMTIKGSRGKMGDNPSKSAGFMFLTDRIEGAGKFGREWAIPADAESPTDGRITTGEYKNWRKKDDNPSD